MIARTGSISTVVALLTLLAACSAPTATPLPFSKEQAIARATQDAKSLELPTTIVELVAQIKRDH